MNININIKWDTEKGTGYDNFTDLGNYVILVDECKTMDIEEAFGYVDNKYDGWDMGCTACAKINSRGEVIMGRNLDMVINQTPVFIIPTSFGKYETINFSSTPDLPYTYKELREIGRIDDRFYNALPLFSSDSFNSAGLYIECNMRPDHPGLSNSGTNPGKRRASMHTIPALVGANCATVKEAIYFLKNSYDYYTTNSENKAISHCNFAFMIGDATGEYGLVEIVKNKITYMPYQFGHANYYISPMANAQQKIGWGYGRLQSMYDIIADIDTEEEFRKGMEKSMWRNGYLYIEDAYRDEDGNIRFVDHDGNSIMDWRTEYEQYFIIDKDGNMIEDTSLESGFEAYCGACFEHDREKIEKLQPVYDEYKECVNRCNGPWVLDDENFEILQKAAKEYIESIDGPHVFDEFHKGNDQPIRDSGEHFISVLNIGINCQKKCLVLRLWENDDIVMKLAWN